MMVSLAPHLSLGNVTRTIHHLPTGGTHHDAPNAMVDMGGMHKIPVVTITALLADCKVDATGQHSMHGLRLMRIPHHWC
jgi:hypothetical protein